VNDSFENGDIELSLCKRFVEGNEEQLEGIFAKYRVPFSKYSQDPIAILSDPDLMVKIEDQVYDWKVALPLVISLLAFKRVFFICQCLNFSLCLKLS
jgi:hypothetical protein